MATISDLHQPKTPEPRLWKVDADLDPTEQEVRLFYASSGLRDWALNALPTLTTAFGIERTPQEQLNVLLATYGAGYVLQIPRDLHVLLPIGDGVWELKTPDLRVFGWFPQKDHFIGVCAEMAMTVKQKGYGGYRLAVVQFRDALPLDEPKFITGNNPDDVVSNYSAA